MASEFSLKLLLNKQTNKVVFAEAGKEFVDFLFSLLALPIGTVIRVLAQEEMAMVGSLGQLYNSLDSLSNTYLQSVSRKDLLLNPPVSSACPPTPMLLPNNPSPPISNKYYCCANCYRYNRHNYSDTHGTPCPDCNNNPMKSEMKFIGKASSSTETATDVVGCVKGVVTYMVMDDLVVSPMSTISSITMLNKFQVKDVGALEERTVCVGMDEGIKMLKASLQSSTVLSDVFLAEKSIK